MSRLTLSLCMIVKNEEKNLPRCLKSVQGLVDQIVIVDTGLTDQTIEIGNQYNADIHQIAWPGDFAAARNISLSYAGCEWILVLDADEELD
jgi:glycosyltransferase involved in cell wall biosynthesis